MMVADLCAVFERVAQVAARLWTWEVSVPFDSELSAERLLELYKYDFPVANQKGEPLFLKMVAFNSDSGRKIRYLVVLAEPATANLKGSCDRILPESITLYGIADDVARGTDGKICECVSSAGKTDGAGNALFSFMCGSRLFILVFCGGRLCHWSEEVGYEEGFGGKAYEGRMERFRKFLKQDEYFSQSGNGKAFCEYRKNMEPWTELKPVNVYFKRAARDPFWRKVNLNREKRLRPLTKKVLAVVTLAVASLAFALWENRDVFCEYAVAENFMGQSSSVFPDDIDLSPPVFAPSGEPRDTMLRLSAFHQFSSHGAGAKMPAELQPADPENSPVAPEIKLRSIVEGVVFQGFVEGALKWFRLGDSIGLFVVKSIGRDHVVLERNGRSVEVKHE